jgi:hypothetical protein
MEETTIMDFTWTVPVALILAATIYLTVARHLRHKEPDCEGELRRGGGAQCAT